MRLRLLNCFAIRTNACRLLGLSLIGFFGLLSGTRADEKVQYNHDNRPILADNCFACHGPDSASRKAGLRLDQRQAAIDLGAVQPGKPAESDMIHRIFADGKEHMPPAATKKTLTAEQK